MIQIISGEKGKGKTKLLIARANEDVTGTTGNLVYMDKTNKHMYELSNKIRLINCTDYLISNSDEFLGFMCGVISQDHDLEKVYLDSFLKIACCTEDRLTPVLTKLSDISSHFGIDFVLSISLNSDSIPENFRENIIISA